MANKFRGAGYGRGRSLNPEKVDRPLAGNTSRFRSEDDESNNRKLQLAEINDLCSLLSDAELKIYENNLEESNLENVDSHSKFTIRGEVFIDPVRESEKIRLIHSDPDDESKSSECVVRNLPPLQLRFCFTLNYPGRYPPYFALVCKWLDRKLLSFLCRQLERIYKRGDCVLKDWIKFLRDETYGCLGIRDTLDLTDVLMKLNMDAKRNYKLIARPCSGRGYEKLDARAFVDFTEPSELIGKLIEFDREHSTQTESRSLRRGMTLPVNNAGAQSFDSIGSSKVECSTSVEVNGQCSSPSLNSDGMEEEGEMSSDTLDSDHRVSKESSYSEGECSKQVEQNSTSDFDGLDPELKKLLSETVIDWSLYTDNIQQQKDEVLAMESIFEKDQFSLYYNRLDEVSGTTREVSPGDYSSTLFTVSGEILIQPTRPSETMTLIYKKSDHCEEEEHISVKHLPPVVLRFGLTPGYPSKEQPWFSLSCKWLDRFQLSAMCEKLDKLFIPGEVVLFTWTDFVKDQLFTVLELVDYQELFGVFSDLKRISTNLHPRPFCGKGGFDSRAVVEVTKPSLLVAELENYNKYKEKEVFNSSVFSCEVCFMDYNGSLMSKLDSCGHIFCNECLNRYFEIEIKSSSGANLPLKCLHHECETIIPDSIILRIGGKELSARYCELMLSSYVNKASDVVYCPRADCQKLVILEPNSTLGQCECTYVFCNMCRMSYHGIAPCRMLPEEQKGLHDAYVNGDETIKVAMERKYGKRNLQKMVQEFMSMEYLHKNGKQCPNCNAFIEKSEGCNKMTCWNCNTYFCWLCGMKLSHASNPYTHFSNISSPCYQKLFEGIEQDEDWDNDFVVIEDDVDFGEYLRFI